MSKHLGYDPKMTLMTHLRRHPSGRLRKVSWNEAVLWSTTISSQLYALWHAGKPKQELTREP